MSQLRWQSLGEWESAQDTEILKLKTVANLSYADACKELRTSRNPPVPHLASQSTLPPLLKSTVDRTLAKPFFKFHSVSAWYRYPTGSGRAHRNGTNWLFQSFVWKASHLSRHLAEVIKQTILTRDKNDNIDVCEIITEAAGGSMGLPVDDEQLKLFNT